MSNTNFCVFVFFTSLILASSFDFAKCEETVGVYRAIKNYIFSFIGGNQNSDIETSSSEILSASRNALGTFFNDIKECLGRAKNFTASNIDAMLKHAVSVASENVFKNISTKLLVEQFPDIFIYFLVAFVEINLILIFLILKSCVSLICKNKRTYKNKRYEIPY